MQYKMMNGRRGRLSDKSVVRDAPMVIAIDIQEIERAKGELSVIMRDVTAIDPEWLRMLYPDDFVSAIECRYDAISKGVVAEEVCRFKNLEVEVKRLPEPPPEDAARILAEEVLTGRLKLKKWDAEIDQWIDRLAYCCAAHPELGWTPFTDDDRRCVIE
jgi:ATP-dependent helicase HrpB